MNSGRTTETSSVFLRRCDSALRCISEILCAVQFKYAGVGVSSSGNSRTSKWIMGRVDPSVEQAVMNSSSLRAASQSCISKAIIAFHHGMPRTARYRIRLCRWASVGSHTFPSHEVVRCCPKQMRHLVRVGILAGRPDGFEYHKDIGYRYSADGSGMGARVVPRFPRLYASTARGKIVSSHPSRLHALLSTPVRLHICRSRDPPRTIEEVGLLISTSAMRFMEV